MANQPPPEAQPKAEDQSTPQEQPKPQEQSKPQAQAKPEGPKAEGPKAEGPKAPVPAKPQGQPAAQGQARPGGAARAGGAAAAAEQPKPKKKMTRREALNFAWLASLGFLTLNMAGLTYLFAMPRFREGEFGGVITIGPVSQLPAVGSAPVNMPKVKMWLSNTDTGVIAIYKVCTHLGCLYNWVNQENKFICPCHGSQYTTKGQYIQGPAPRSLDRFLLQIVDPNNGNVLAQSNAAGDPVPVPNNPDALVKVNTGSRIQGKSHG